ncbi:MAG: hypothetical protein AAGA18_06785 [Verrucomicrobiota bacterium]
MNFLKIPERINQLLYKKALGRLSREDVKLADDWTLALIRERYPYWSDRQIKRYHQNLLKIQVVAVDEWSRRIQA